MIHFVGAGSGGADLITVRGARLLGEADCIIYAGSLVNPDVLQYAGPSCTLYDSAGMTLEEVIDRMAENERAGKSTVRLHTGDPSLYGAIREQMDRLDALSLPYDVTPGVSSFCGAAAALQAEYTLPDVSQSVIITRMAGRTPVPEGEALRKMASHGCTMVLFLSTGLLEDVERELLAGGAYTPDTPAAIVYKATWPDEKVFRCTVGTLAKTARDSHITKTSSHFIVGIEGEIIQCIPTKEVAYASNSRNNDTVSIETCYINEDGSYEQATYDSLVHLTAWLMGKFNLKIDAVIRHYDVTGKLCPLYFVEHEDAWAQFKQDVVDYIEANGSTPPKEQE